MYSLKGALFLLFFSLFIDYVLNRTAIFVPFIKSLQENKLKYERFFHNPIKQHTLTNSLLSFKCILLKFYKVKNALKPHFFQNT